MAIIIVPMMMVQTICEELKYGASRRLAPSSTAMTDTPAKNSVRYRYSLLFSMGRSFIFFPPLLQISNFDTIPETAVLQGKSELFGIMPDSALLFHRRRCCISAGKMIKHRYAMRAEERNDSNEKDIYRRISGADTDAGLRLRSGAAAAGHGDFRADSLAHGGYPHGGREGAGQYEHRGQGGAAFHNTPRFPGSEPDRRADKQRNKIRRDGAYRRDESHAAGVSRRRFCRFRQEHHLAGAAEEFCFRP